MLLAGNRMATQTFREKRKDEVESFSMLFLMSPLTWITEKELERVIKTKKTNLIVQNNGKEM